MDREEIDRVICDIMIHEGPDRHIDGHSIITDFVMAVREGWGYGWHENHLKKRADLKAERLKEDEEIAQALAKYK